MRTGSMSLLGRKTLLNLVAIPFLGIIGDKSHATSRLTSSIQLSTALRIFREWFDQGSHWVQLLGDHQRTRRIKMFGKAEVDEDENELPVAPQLKLSEVLQAAESRRSDKPEISDIDPGMTEFTSSRRNGISRHRCGHGRVTSSRNAGNFRHRSRYDCNW